MEVKPCGLISVIPPALQQEWAANLTELARLFRPAALIFESPDPAVLAQAIAGAQPLELAVLIAGDAGKAAAAGASGVYLTIPGEDAVRARTVFGSAGIVGTACGLSRHAAMESAKPAPISSPSTLQIPKLGNKRLNCRCGGTRSAEYPSRSPLAARARDKSVLTKARPDFLMIEEAHRAGESLIFATEFGLQSQT